ncbi:MAG: tripartite tricarboxylate transporter substrate binding protein [Rhodospirillales bacterium]|nr:tripartite tricarboxylate transporter substrate binding protein [Rhodospirillales bacterium]
MKNAFAALLVALALLAAPPAAAQRDYPTKPVRVIVSFPSGSMPDIAARTIAPALHQALGQPFIIENRSGAARNTGAEAVAKAPPDGHTLLVSTNGPIAIDQLLHTDLPYDPMRDLAPVVLLVRAPQILVVGNAFPADDFKSFIGHAKRNPGKISYGSVGGSVGHLAMEDLKAKFGVEIVHVPYRDFRTAVDDLLAGRIQAMFAMGNSVLPQLESGKMKGLAITSAERWPAAPNLPTLAELGYAGAESYVWIGLLAPARTPAPIIERLNEAAEAALAAPEQRKALEKQGFEIVGGSAEAFDRHRRAEAKHWAEVIKRTGAKAE